MYPNRKSPRAKWIEYNCGTFFITACVHEKHHAFGYIRNGKMHRSEIGEILHHELSVFSERYADIDIPMFVVMPNHFHAIVSITTPDEARFVPTEQAVQQRMDKTARPRLSIVVAHIKSAVSRQARLVDPMFKWQSRYHDRLIRNQAEANRISTYISENVDRWAYDCFNILPMR